MTGPFSDDTGCGSRCYGSRSSGSRAIAFGRAASGTEGDVGLVAANARGPAGRPRRRCSTDTASTCSESLPACWDPIRSFRNLVQDVFVAALTSVDRIQDPRLLRGWLSSIAVFTARTRIRRRSRWRFVRLLPTFELPEVPAAYVTTEVSEALRCTYRILDRMPADGSGSFLRSASWRGWK